MDKGCRRSSIVRSAGKTRSNGGHRLSAFTDNSRSAAARGLPRAECLLHEPLAHGECPQWAECGHIAFPPCEDSGAIAEAALCRLPQRHCAQENAVTGYRPQLDSLRALAVSTVLLAHFWLPNLGLSSLGVRMFFVLSGYLLTSILLRERHDAAVCGAGRGTLLTHFYLRRILRIWPAYYAALAAAVLAGAHQLEETIAWHALFGSNILFFLEQQWYPPIASHLWTLAVEEQFYLVLPVVILFVPQRLLPSLLVVFVAAAIIYRSVVAANVGGTNDFYFLLPIAQLDALAGGALLALVQKRKGPVNWKMLLGWSVPATALLLLLPLPDGVDFTLTPAVEVLVMAGLVAAADAGIGGTAGAILSSRPLVALGRISYGIYLYHNFVAAAFNAGAVRLGYPEFSGPFAFVLFYILTAIVAAASWFALERPALSLRRHFKRVPRGALIPAGLKPS